MPRQGGNRSDLIRSVRQGAIYIPYYLGYVVFNYVGIVEGLLDSRVRPFRQARR